MAHTTTVDRLPEARGPITSAVFSSWRSGASVPAPEQLAEAIVAEDPLAGDDLHLALWCCYQLHYGGFAELGDDLEWDLSTLELRAALEQRFEEALRSEASTVELPAEVGCALRVISERAGPPLSSTVASTEDRALARRRLQEFAVHRSSYQLKEADAHTWGIPRLAGAGRSALIEIQADEYGGGVPGEAHAELFAEAMEQLGLDPAFGAHLDALPGVTLATDNLISMFGLHRRLRGALVGHLALFEMCSVTPMSRYLSAARRLGDAPALERFYEVHVEVDAHHGRIALEEMAVPLAEDQPDLAQDIVFGALALSRVEARFASHVLRCWDDGRSSLRGSDTGRGTIVPWPSDRPTATSRSERTAVPA